MGVLRNRIVSGVAVLLALGLVSLMVVQTSKALFSSTTANSANSWATGSVTLGDDDTGSAMFTTAGDGVLTGGQSIVKCITVTYTGTITSGVSTKLYTSSTGTLTPYLDVVIEEGTGGAYGNCTGFVSGSTIFTNTLSYMNTNNTNFATGVGSWAPSANPQSKTYRISITAQSGAAAQGKTASGSFTWEAQA